MKKLILIALVIAALNASAATMGIKPIINGPKCYGEASGSISLTINNGVAPYTYLWSNGATTATLTNVPAGSYAVTVTDANHQVATYTLVMTQVPQLVLSTSAVNASGQGSTDGCIHLSVSGGTPNYQFDWNNGSTVQSPCGLAAGTYTVTVTDAFGCTSTASKTVTQPQNSNQIQHRYVPSVPQWHPHETSTAGSHIYRNGELTSTDETVTEETPATEEVVVFPNPTTDFVSVRTSSTSGELMLINTLGQTVQHQYVASNETKMDVSNIAKGNYILVVKTELGSTNKMLTVVR